MIPVKLAVLGYRVCVAGIIFLALASLAATWMVPEPILTQVLSIFIASMAAFGVGFLANVMVLKQYLKAFDSDAGRRQKVRALRP